MEENIPAQSVTQSTPKKKLPQWLTTVTPFSKLLAMALFIALPLVGFYLGIKYQKNMSISISPSNLDKVANYMPKASGKPIIKDAEVGYAIINGKIILRYGGNYYDEDKNVFDTNSITLVNPSSYIWTKLTDRPATNDRYAWDQLFSFKRSPIDNSFLFVMRWVTEQNSKFNHKYEVFYFNNANKTLSNILSLIDTQSSLPSIPRISQFSADGKFVSFDMYGCWACEPGHPDTLLLNLINGNSKRIGKVYNFTWGENGNYSYKEYKVIDCTESKPGECTEDPSILPLINGQFN